MARKSPSSKSWLYHHFDHDVSPDTKVTLFIGEMLLQELLQDATLLAYGCLIIDEMLEQTAGADTLLSAVGKCGSRNTKNL
ncbi:hypothetical protein K470DRAFT_254538 [Piedraia hortae CBS 480.64]|uniref:Uncharacterized protein n=1 Tax=Piedraia hortae CBS 480.64 TaxID=1314780 RepID=A0A6A7C9M3_9PEZI|nr:hypothetical protein K470DRAFT_254538 [Piedraia hortae CBS 480.64]